MPVRVTPTGAPDVKLVLLSIVVAPFVLSRRIRKVTSAPSLSAEAMRQQPWTMIPAVQRCSRKKNRGGELVEAGGGERNVQQMGQSQGRVADDLERGQGKVLSGLRQATTAPAVGQRFDRTALGH